MTDGPHLRLVLPHQLFAEQLQVDPGTVVVVVEHDLLYRQYAFHSHKLVLHRASTARFAQRLRDHGLEVHVLTSDAHRSSRDQLAGLVRDLAPTRVTWFDVVDDWMEQDLEAALADGGYAVQVTDVLESPGFLTDRDQIDGWFQGDQARMQDFYVWQRRRLGILLDGSGPRGGRWSFDEDNRKRLPRGYEPRRVGLFAGHPALARDDVFDLDALMGDEEPESEAPRDPEVDRAVAWVAEEFPDAPGDPHLFAWPTSSAEARAHLAEFVRDRLRDFGPYEDAISAQHPFVAHSLLTACLNIGLLDPREVVRAVLDGAGPDTPLASVEGFVRQVIGWREYVRATYRVHGRRMRTSNRLDHRSSLGDGWWDATTGLLPVDLVVSRVLTTGYAHHIERLMVLGSAMCLLRVDPDEVYEWFMAMFVDAYDWVMVPNVYAMSQFAAGDAVTTKPYVSGSSYLRKMSDLPTGEWAADWDALYWAFVEDHREVLEGNRRTQTTVELLDRADPVVRDERRARADALLRPGDGSRLVRVPPSR